MERRTEAAERRTAQREGLAVAEDPKPRRAPLAGCQTQVSAGEPERAAKGPASKVAKEGSGAPNKIV